MAGTTIDTFELEEIIAILKSMAVHPSRIFGETNARESSVVLALTRSEDEYKIVFQKRAAHIPQGGEVCFPGGRIEKNEDSRTAAVREFLEECGIGREFLEICGYFGAMSNTRGMLIHVWIAFLHPGYEFHPNEEVDRIFFESVERLMNMEAKEYKVGIKMNSLETDKPIPFEKYGLSDFYKKSWRGRDIHVYFYENLEELLWGVTARITREFILRLKHSIKI
jgi:coenzyme A diphosphatase NUDT7